MEMKNTNYNNSSSGDEEDIDIPVINESLLRVDPKLRVNSNLRNPVQPKL